MDNKTNFGHLEGKIININKLPFLDDILAGNYFLGIMEVNRNERRSDYIPIIFSFVDLKKHPMLINNGKFSIDGSFRALMVYSSNRNQKFQVFYPSRIVEQTKDRQNLINKAIDKNSINLTGKIERMSKIKTIRSKKEMLKFLLRVNESQPKYSSLISCVAWRRESEFINMLGEGEEISIQGCIQSQLAYYSHYSKNFVYGMNPNLKNCVSVFKVKSEDEIEV